MSATGSALAERAGGYGVALTCGEMDQWQHNVLFADELSPAFAASGVPLKRLDYRAQPRDVYRALNDADCAFFLCFNGFGSELQVSEPELRASRAQPKPGCFRSAYEYFHKPLFDLMHDCPAHESMEHQVESLFSRRNLLLTDYGYVGMAKTLGVRHARFVPSIAFPTTLPGPPRPMRARSIEILLPLGFQDPEVSRRRYVDTSYRGRVYRVIFEAVVEACVANLRLDPLHEVLAACQDAGLEFDPRDPDSRFLLTTALDFVKFARRQRLVRAVAHLPVSIMSRAPFEEGTPGCRLRPIQTRSASEMLAAIAETRCVICPLPHMTGYHERALGAFTAGAAVVASPNHILETEFNHGQGVLIYQSELELVDILEKTLASPDWLEPIAARGRERALARFSPLRLAETILSLLSSEPALHVARG